MFHNQREEREPGVTIEHHIGNIVGKVGPSMLLTSTSEALAFFLGMHFKNITAFTSFISRECM